MEASKELIQILQDTKEWALDTNLNFDDIYSEWSSQGELLDHLNELIIDAKDSMTDFGKLYVLYAPTAGLCEIVASDDAIKNYMSLAARFDNWYASVRPC